MSYLDNNLFGVKIKSPKEIIKLDTSRYTEVRYSQKQCIELFGYSRSEIHHSLLNDFAIPEMLQCSLHTYSILHWSGEQFTDRLRDGTITVYSRAFHVIYKNCSPVQVAKARELGLRLSFRQCIPEIGLPAYVLVKLARNPGNNTLDSTTKE